MPHTSATPLDADVVDGEVVLTSKQSATSVSLTPEAALETAKKLASAAHAAQEMAVNADNDRG